MSKMERREEKRKKRSSTLQLTLRCKTGTNANEH
jgi:hypothetical protein